MKMNHTALTIYRDNLDGDEVELELAIEGNFLRGDSSVGIGDTFEDVTGFEAETDVEFDLDYDDLNNAINALLKSRADDRHDHRFNL